MPDVGALHGVVLGYDGAPLAGGEVELNSREESFTVKVGGGGKFNVYAHPGIYSLKVTRSGMVPYQRAQIVLRPGSVANVHVRPVLSDPDPKLHYFSFGVPGPRQLGAVLRSVERVRPGPRTTFAQDWVMLSYDTLVVYAKTLSCDRRNFRCLAEGGVVTEISTDEGVKMEQAARAEIRLPENLLLIYKEDTAEERKF